MQSSDWFTCLTPLVRVLSSDQKNFFKDLVMAYMALWGLQLVTVPWTHGQ